MPRQKQKTYSFHIKNWQIIFCMGDYCTLRNKKCNHCATTHKCQDIWSWMILVLFYIIFSISFPLLKTFLFHLLLHHNKSLVYLCKIHFLPSLSQPWDGFIFNFTTSPFFISFWWTSLVLRLLSTTCIMFNKTLNSLYLSSFLYNMATPSL